MEKFLVALVLSAALAGFAAWRRSLTGAGLALAFLFSVFIAYFGGVPAFFALAFTFFLTAAAGRIFPPRRKKAEELNAKSGRRDAAQIFCNVGTGCAAMALYGLSGNEAFFIAFGAAMAASLSDSMASEIGVLSKRLPRDILSGKIVPAGLSGGVSALGFFASCCGALAVSGVFVVLGGRSAPAFFIIFTCGTLAALLDSVLGALVQGKYRCGVCGKISEKKAHCGVRSEIFSGFSWASNDFVNLLNNIFSAVVAYALWLLVG